MEKQKKNFDIEISGLDLGINVLKEKIKKRDEQYDESEALVKKQADEVKRIQKEINPKLLKSLHQKYTKNSVP